MVESHFNPISGIAVAAFMPQIVFVFFDKPDFGFVIFLRAFVAGHRRMLAIKRLRTADEVPAGQGHPHRKIRILHAPEVRIETAYCGERRFAGHQRTGGCSRSVENASLSAEKKDVIRQFLANRHSGHRPDRSNVHFITVRVSAPAGSIAGKQRDSGLRFIIQQRPVLYGQPMGKALVVIVEERNKFARGFLQNGVSRGCRPAIAFMDYERHAPVPVRETSKDVFRRILGSIVDDDDFEVRPFLGQRAGHRPFDGVGGVIAGDADRNARYRGLHGESRAYEYNAVSEELKESSKCPSLRLYLQFGHTQ